MRTKPLKIESSEMALIVSFYLFMMINYYLVLLIDTGIQFHVWAVSLNHLLKAILTLPLWWLLFRYLSKLSIWKKIFIHLFTLPAFSFIWIIVYYQLCDYFNLFYLKDTRQVWDFYLTALFYIIQFANFHLYDFYVRHRKQKLMTAELQQMALQSELTALKAQLNPHFLYNVFNTINASIPATSERTRNMVAKLSDLFRYQLKASKEELITVKEELEFVKKYLELEKERFEERLQFHVEIDESALNKTIPPILIQPLVENSIKHGISPLIAGGEIKISIQQKGDELFFSIADTGIGLQQHSVQEVLNKGVGLSNTHERLIKMYGAGLQFENQSPNGLAILFSIPLTQNI